VDSATSQIQRAENFARLTFNSAGSSYNPVVVNYKVLRDDQQFARKRPQRICR